MSSTPIACLEHAPGYLSDAPGPRRSGRPGCPSLLRSRLDGRGEPPKSIPIEHGPAREEAGDLLELGGVLLLNLRGPAAWILTWYGLACMASIHCYLSVGHPIHSAVLASLRTFSIMFLIGGGPMLLRLSRKVLQAETVPGTSKNALQNFLQALPH